MPTFLRALLLGWATLLLAVGSASAQQPPIRIQDVHVGFPYGPQNDWAKAGTWAPVLVRIGPPISRETGSVALAGDFSAELRVSTSDGDGARTLFTPKLVGIKREEITRDRPDRTFVTYIKVGALTNEIRVELVNAKIGESRVEVRPFAYFGDAEGRNFGMDNRQQLVLALGRTRGLDPRQNADMDPDKNDPRSFRLATINRLEELPELWFGYQAADVVILPTGGTWAGSLAQALSADPQRRAALEQWVAQGGHLVVTVGSNASIVANRTSFPLEPLLPARIDPTAGARQTRLDSLRSYLDQNVPAALRQKPREGIKAFVTELASLTPTGNGVPLVSEQNSRIPVVVRGSHGLGRVTVVGFDVDREPFNSWENQQDFWTALLEMKQGKQFGKNQANFGGNETGGSYTERLGNEMESFGDVAVISFFWVAIFILLYVIIIGPVDYFILKKVVKRLELTWITFPLMVLLVSLAAYFGAYWLKGDELRLNKVDVIDIDQTHGLAVGTTWFSVFSPRLQSYDFGLEPLGLGKPRDGLALSWFARDGYGFRGVERNQTDLFQREYLLADNGAAIQGVPIQVWAMKTFTGRWQTQLDGQLPILGTLRGANNLLSGTVASRLPQELSDAWLIYKNNLYKVGALKPNETFRVPSENQTLSRQTMFFSPVARTTSSGQPLSNYAATVGRLMFFRWFAQEAQNDSNELIAYLDQTRRLNGEEAILIGLYEDASGSAPEMNEAARFGSKLKSPQLRGTLRQCTYVRVYLPVRATAEK